VLFRESERFDLALWLRHLLRDREDLPQVAAACCCGVLILVLRFFMGLVLPQPDSFRGFAALALVTQLAVIASPALLMTVMLARSPRRTLLLRWPAWWTVPAAVLLAVALHPAANLLQAVVLRLYPAHDGLTRALEKLLAEPVPLWLLLGVLAAAPAVCEELAFRGFILSGLQRAGAWRGIVLSSLFFGVAHAIFQQSILATLVGLVLGYVAVRTASLAPCVLFHATHNSLAVLTSRIDDGLIERFPLLRGLVYESAAGSGYLYRPAAVALGCLVALVILWRLGRMGRPAASGNSAGVDSSTLQSSAGTL
jgi:sodium transport system permease protein